jgi:hypothetical protein
MFVCIGCSTGSTKSVYSNWLVDGVYRKGKVEGRTISLVGGEFELDPVDVYLGIPYALPPVGIWRY